MNFISRFIVWVIKFYQKSISPKKAPCCRFSPSCSAYAIEAITVHGAVKGTALAIWRVLRCNPLCKGGFDPVPEKKDRKQRN